MEPGSYFFIGVISAVKAGEEEGRGWSRLESETGKGGFVFE